MAEDVIRQRTIRATRTELTEAKIQEVIGNVFDGTKQVVCTHCGRNTPVPLPNLKDLVLLIEALEGKVPEPPQKVDVSVNVLTMTLPEKLALLEEKRRERALLERPGGDDAA